MNDHLTNLVESLREEMKQYGEMLALLDHQQGLVVRRETAELLVSVSDINAQTSVISAARHEREQRLRQLARILGLPEEAGFAGVIPMVPPHYRPLLTALVQENNELLIRVQKRVRQNHLLMSHTVDLMRQLVNALCPGAAPLTYDGAGRVPGQGLASHSLYQAVG